jgi:precorrin-2 dehydrogenase/sirohydrochlorin ferrochelatase
MMVRLTGRKCLVVGAGEIAADKIDGLLKHGPEIVVVSPRAIESIQEQAGSGVIRWVQREFEANDVDGAFLVIAATNSSVVNKAVFAACTVRNVLCNSVDDPEHCDFFYPAVVRRGALQIAISTNGHSPALAARLRRELEQQFGPEWAEFVEHVREKRREVLGKELPTDSRRDQLLQMAEAEEFDEFLRNRAKQTNAKKR